MEMKSAWLSSMKRWKSGILNEGREGSLVFFLFRGRSCINVGMVKARSPIEPPLEEQITGSFVYRAHSCQRPSLRRKLPREYVVSRMKYREQWARARVREELAGHNMRMS